MNKYIQKLAINFLSLSLIIGNSFITLATSAQAQNKSSNKVQKLQVTFDPPKGNKPQYTVGGASRGKRCPIYSEDKDFPLTPLVPENSPALTIESHPTLLAYIPKSSATHALLRIKDAEEEYDYQASVPISDRGGIMSFTLPTDAPALDINKEYQWSLVLMCDNQLRPDSPVIQGDIKRVHIDSNMAQELSQADLLKSASIYGKAGLWYDAINIVAHLKVTRPQDSEVSITWENLLKTAGLDNVAKAKFVE